MLLLLELHKLLHKVVGLGKDIAQVAQLAARQCPNLLRTLKGLCRVQDSQGRGKIGDLEK